MQDHFSWIILVLVGMISVLMVSNIRYPSFKKIDFKKANFKKVLIILIVLFSFTYLYLIESITLFFTAYILYGLGRGVKSYNKRKKIAKKDKI
jgi:CDP-diacylglycerol--serine O-phosphatidyltransferase